MCNIKSIHFGPSKDIEKIVQDEAGRDGQESSCTWLYHGLFWDEMRNDSSPLKSFKFDNTELMDHRIW